MQIYLFDIAFIQVYCNDGQYSSTATILFQSPEDSVKSLFHESKGSIVNIIRSKDMVKSKAIYFWGQVNASSLAFMF